jgi:hypothetical protein
VLIRRHHELREDDNAAGPRMTWVNGVVGSGMARGAQGRGLKEDDIVVGFRTM